MIVLVTFLPTLLMNIINQCTNYIRSKDNDHFAEIIKVNITCMMVLASIYISVFTNSPPSGEIKMVDIWLLASFLYPFLVIMVNMLMHFNMFQPKETRKITPSNVNSNVHSLDGSQTSGNDCDKEGSVVRDVKLNRRFDYLTLTTKRTANYKLEIIANYVIPSCYLLFIVIYSIRVFSLDS